MFDSNQSQWVEHLALGLEYLCTNMLAKCIRWTEYDFSLESKRYRSWKCSPKSLDDEIFPVYGLNDFNSIIIKRKEKSDATMNWQQRVAKFTDLHPQ